MILFNFFHAPAIHALSCLYIGGLHISNNMDPDQIVSLVQSACLHDKTSQKCMSSAGNIFLT